MHKTVTLHPDRRVGALHHISRLVPVSKLHFLPYYTLDFSKPYA